jgi:hypothetical protein
MVAQSLEVIDPVKWWEATGNAHRLIGFLLPSRDLCYVMLCYVMLCYVMLCYVMLCYVMYIFRPGGRRP